MDAAGYRTPKTQGRKLVSIATQGASDLVAGDKRELPAGPRRVSTAEGYECWAPFYDEFPNPLLAREERYLLPLLTNLHYKSVLDLACGTGRWLERLIGQGCESGIGIDCSSAMLRVAGSKRAIKGRLAKANCENLPFSSTAFDLAICSFVLGHIKDIGSTVCELARVTRTGADIFVSDLHPEAYAGGWRVGFRDGAMAVEIEMRPRATEEIVSTFCASGFKSRSHETLWLGEPEKPLFARAGKPHSFVEACTLPAVLVHRFRRIESQEQRGAE
jgi:ubiquinone/menaquinone biosynthesis C-methylase UbiE